MYRTGFVKQESLEDLKDIKVKKDSIKLPVQAVALEKKKQSRFTKKVNKLKKDVESGDVKIQEEIPAKIKKKPYKRGLVYLSHIPHGFFEPQLNDYFAQFGKVTNVMICRSQRTGKSRGMGYVEFSNPEVAKIAAETMDNYLMFKRRIIAKLLPPEQSKSSIFGTKISKSNPIGLKKRRRTNSLKNKNIPTTKYVKNTTVTLKKIDKKLKALEAFGIDYTLTPVNLPKKLKINTKLSKVIENKDHVELTKKIKKENDHTKLTKKVKEENNYVKLTKKIKEENNKEENNSLKLTQKVKEGNKHVKLTKKVKEENDLVKLRKKEVPQKKAGGITKNFKKGNPRNEIKAKSDLMKMAAKELLKNSDHIITTRSSLKKLKNKKNK